MAKKHLTPEQIENIEQTIAIMRLEGMEPPPGAVELLERRAKGEISLEEAKNIAKKWVLEGR